MKIKRHHLIVAVCTGLLGVVALYCLVSGQTDTDNRSVTVEKMLVADLVRVRGIVSPRNATSVTSGDWSYITELAETGEHVVEGDLLLRSVPSFGANSLNNLAHWMAESQAATNRWNAEFGLVKTRETNRLILLKKDLELASLQLKAASAGLTDAERRSLDIDIRIAELDLADASDDLARLKDLCAKGYASDATLGPVTLNAQTAAAALDKHETQLRLLSLGPGTEELTRLTEDIHRIKQLIDNADRQLAAGVAHAQASLAAQAGDLSHAQLCLELKQADMDKMTIRAKTNGILRIAEFKGWRSGRALREYYVGAELNRGTHFATIIDPTSMRVDLAIHEADAWRLRDGMRAEIRFPALPKTLLRGCLTNLAGVARDRFEVLPRGQEDGPTGVSAFRGEVLLETTTRIRPGMSAIVDIMVDTPSQHLVIPRQAVRRRNDEFVVRQKAMFGSTEVVVEGSISAQGHFQVTRGLEEGDIVLLNQKAEP